MNIVVCIKQVPGTNVVEVDEKTGVLKRTGIESKMNPYDLYALETALKIKEKVEANITVVTMGPPQAKNIIKEAYMMGADNGYVFSDIKFAGADVLATSYTLAQGIHAIGKYDLIICGKQTTDGDTAQVGPAIAEHHCIPHVSWVKILQEIDEEKIVVMQDMSESYEVVELHYPCLISVEKDIYEPRLPSYRRKIATKDKPINVISFKDFAERNEKKYGLTGSPTQVERIFPPESNTKHVLWEDEPLTLAVNIHNILKETKII